MFEGCIQKNKKAEDTDQSVKVNPDIAMVTETEDHETNEQRCSSKAGDIFVHGHDY